MSNSIVFKLYNNGNIETSQTKEINDGTTLSNQSLNIQDILIEQSEACVDNRLLVLNNGTLNIKGMLSEVSH